MRSDFMNKEGTCSRYAEDDWGICKHKKDWENENCDENCFLNLYEYDSNTTPADNMTKDEIILQNTQ
jgi:hypothetical protein